MLQCLTPEEQKKLQHEFTILSDEELKTRTDGLLAKMDGYRIVKREPVSTEEVVLHVAEMSGADQGHSGRLVFKKYDTEWKMSEAKQIDDRVVA